MAEPVEPASTRGERVEFEAMLNELIERPYEREEIEHRIVERFTRDKAVLVLDMSGFSRTTQVRGIVPYLLMIHQMRLLATPVIETHGGRIVEAVADNLLCSFDSVDDAVAASGELMRALHAANVVLPQELELYASIGIGYGPVLCIGDHRVAGNEVNLASKLGEDIADRGEILLTEAARGQLAAGSFGEHRIAISGLELTYYSVAPER